MIIPENLTLEELIGAIKTEAHNRNYDESAWELISDLNILETIKRKFDELEAKIK